MWFYLLVPFAKALPFGVHTVSLSVSLSHTHSNGTFVCCTPSTFDVFAPSLCLHISTKSPGMENESVCVHLLLCCYNLNSLRAHVPNLDSPCAVIVCAVVVVVVLVAAGGIGRA